MNAGFKIFLSMSLSGGLLILILLLGKQFWKDKISRQWQYYIWLVIVLRLLLPFGPEVSLLGKVYQAADRSITRAAPVPSPPRSPLNTQEGVPTPAVRAGVDHENENIHDEDVTTARAPQAAGVLQINYIWLVWLMAALGLLIRKITIYQGFVRYIKAGLTPLSDIEMLDRLDIVRPERSFYTLNVNPKGSVNIKIVRDADNKITGVAYMTEAEVTELFGDMDDSDGEDNDADNILEDMLLDLNTSL